MSGSSDQFTGITFPIDEFRQLREDPIEWVFLVGNRLLVAGGVLVGIVSLLSALELTGIASMQHVDATFYLLGGLVSGNATLIGLVISINQVVVSRQLGSPGELREQINNVTEYRESVLAEPDVDVVPVTPSDFLKVLLQTSRRQVQRLGGYVTEEANEETREEIDEFVSGLTAHIDEMTHLLEQSGIGTFNTLAATLTTNYAQRIYQARSIKANYGEDLSEEAIEGLEDAVAQLQQIDVARQYFKTLYTQTELAYLSRVLLYTGICSELLLVITLLIFTTTESSGVLPAGFPHIAVPIVTGLGLAPLAVLLAFVLRLAVVTQRTAAITPFTTPEQER